MYTFNITSKSIFTFLFFATMLCACKKEKNSFAGKDDFIISFSLKKGNIIFNAAITDSVITLKAPDNISLDTAKAAITLSENAKIYPDPASISSWDEDAQFVVTAHDGTQRTYRYTVERTSIDAAGSVVLATQADVESFGKMGVTEIGGNLIIGSTTGTDSITSLAPLYQLKKVNYSLIVYPTYAGREFVGLDNLQTVGDALQLQGIDSLQNVSFPSLVNAGSIAIKSAILQNVQFPKLTGVSKSITLDGPLGGVNFPALKTTGGNITFNTGSNSGALLSVINFPVLTQTGGIYEYFFQQLTKVQLPELVSSGDLNFSYSQSLYMLSAPKLQTAGIITITDPSHLSELNFPMLTNLGGMVAAGKSITAIEAPKLKMISGDLNLVRIGMTDLEGFPALTQVQGTFTMSELPMTTFTLPSSLTQIGKLSIYYRTVPSPAEINVKGLNINELALQIAGSIRLIGDDVFKGTLTVSPQATATFPTLQGFSEIDSLSFDGYISYMNDVQINGIRKINKSFVMPNNNVSTFGMPDLEEVGGDFIINQFAQLTQTTLQIPKLQKVGGSFSVMIQSTNVTTLQFDALTTVNGDCNIGTGYDDRSLSTLLFPALQTIGKKLTVFGDSDWSPNTKLTNLDGFATLKTVQGIEVRGQSVLTSYEGFKNVLHSFSPANWSATNNAYNPGYADLSAGNWKQ